MNGPAVRTVDLSRRYGSTEAVRHVDIEVGAGELFGIVGPDGAGKTTLIQMLCGILEPSAGVAEVLGMDVARDAARIASRLGYMSQQFSLYGNLSVDENISFFADIHSVPADRRADRTRRLLEFSRLAPFRARLARNLSGGMQKKLALATTLVHGPELLFLDEPTTGVDPLSRRDFWELVFDSVGEGTTVIVATPYLDEAERCDRVAFMHGGRILAIDSPAALRAGVGGQMAEIWATDPLRALQFLRSDPEVRRAEIFGRSIHALLEDVSAWRRVEDRLRAHDIVVEAARCIDPDLEDVFVQLLSGRVDGTLSPEAPSTGESGIVRTASVAAGPTGDKPSRPESRSAREPGADPAIEVQGLVRRFGRFTAVNELSFSVRRGEVFGFLGPNGSGKSTTIRMLTGLLRPSGGTARIAGFDVRRDAARVRPVLGYMSQRFSLYDDLTVSENIAFFAGLYGVGRAQLAERRTSALARAGLRGREQLRTRDLPGGWKQQLALACATLHEPEILLLDEPTSGVDPLSRRRFWDVIFEFAASGVTVLVTTHYMDEAERCERIALIAEGRILAMGTPAQLRQRLTGRMLELEVDDPIRALRVVRPVPGVIRASLFGARLRVTVEEGFAEPVRAALIRAGHTPGAMGIAPVRMEDVFVATVESAAGSAAEEGTRPA